MEELNSENDNGLQSGASVPLGEIPNEETLMSKVSSETEILESTEHEPIVEPTSQLAAQSSESSEELQPVADFDEIKNPSTPSAHLGEIPDEETSMNEVSSETEILENTELEPIVEPASQLAAQSSESSEVELPFIKSVPEHDQSIGFTNSSAIGINDDFELEEVEQEISEENEDTSSASSVFPDEEGGEPDNSLDIQENAARDDHDDGVGDAVIFEYSEDDNLTNTTESTVNNFANSKEDIYSKVVLSEKPAERAQDTNQNNSQQGGQINEDATEQKTSSNINDQSASATFNGNDEDILSERLDVNQKPNGFNYHIFRPKSTGNGSLAISSVAVVAAMILLVCCCCIGYRRRRSRYSKPSRGRYSAIGSEDFFNGTFSDDISFNGKDSDEEMSYGSDDDHGDGIKIELGSMHEVESNGGLTLEEING